MTSNQNIISALADTLWPAGLKLASQVNKWLTANVETTISGGDGPETLLKELQEWKTCFQNALASPRPALCNWFLKGCLTVTSFIETAINGLGEDGFLYDIVNCGPRHRFCTPTLVASNCLGLGYACGHKKFLWMATALYGAGDVFDAEITQEDVDNYASYLQRIGDSAHLKWFRDPNVPEQEKIRHVNAWKTVEDYRANSPQITGLWVEIGNAFRSAAARGDDLETTLPSGRVLPYRKLGFRKNDDGSSDITARIVKNGKWTRVKVYGGLGTENLVQATARDVFRDALLRVHDAGHKIILHVHDELVVETGKARAEGAAEDIKRLMGMPVPWAPGLPIEAEVEISEHYKK